MFQQHVAAIAVVYQIYFYNYILLSLNPKNLKCQNNRPMYQGIIRMMLLLLWKQFTLFTLFNSGKVQRDMLYVYWVGNSRWVNRINRNICLFEMGVNMQKSKKATAMPLYCIVCAQYIQDAQVLKHAFKDNICCKLDVLNLSRLRDPFQGTKLSNGLIILTPIQLVRA